MTLTLTIMCFFPFRSIFSLMTYLSHISHPQTLQLPCESSNNCLQYPLLIDRRMQFEPGLDVGGSWKIRFTSTLLAPPSTYARACLIQREEHIVLQIWGVEKVLPIGWATTKLCAHRPLPCWRSPPHATATVQFPSGCCSDVTLGGGVWLWRLLQNI